MTAFAVVALAVPSAAGAWTWPVPGPVLRGFLFSPDDPLAPGQHRGIDIEGPLGGAVLAPAAGKVTFVGRVAANGLTVSIQTPDGYAVTLLHLGAASVASGTVVAEGQPVALVGTSGVPEHPVPYVQLGVRLGSDPEGYLDPQGFLPPLAQAPLPPQQQPGPDPQPLPTAPPAGSVTPPPRSEVAPPRVTAPVGTSPDRPVPRVESRRGVSSSAANAKVAVSAGSTAFVASVSPIPALNVHPREAATTRTAGRSPIPATHSPAPASPRPSHPWLRPLDPAVTKATATAGAGGHGAPLPPPAVVALLLALAGAICLCAREFRRRAARIIGGDALLPDHPDLLRELEPAHRARVHDDRRGRAHPSPQAAR